MAGLFDDIPDFQQPSGLFDDIPDVQQPTGIFDTAVSWGKSLLPDSWTGEDKKPKTVAETLTLKDPQLDPELNRQTMLRSGSPDSVMFDAGRGKARADDMVERGAALETAAKKGGFQSVPEFVDAVKTTEQRKAFANENPVMGGFASGAASSLSGLANSPAVAADFFNKVIVNPVLNAVGVDEIKKVSNIPGVDTLQRYAGDYSPDITNLSLSKANEKGVLGEWVVANLAQNSQSMALSLASAFVPPLRAVLLPSMGATSAGNAYASGDDSRVAVAKGMLEAGSEMLPLGVFEKLAKLPLSASKTVLADAGKRLLAAGGAITAQHVTEAIEEGVNAFGGNVLDKYVQGKNVGLMGGVPEAMAIGGIAGGALGVGHVARIASQSTRTNDAERALSELLDGGQFTDAGVQSDVLQQFQGRAADGDISPASTRRTLVQNFSDPSSPASQAGITPVVVPIAPVAPAAETQVAAPEMQPAVTPVATPAEMTAPTAQTAAAIAPELTTATPSNPVPLTSSANLLQRTEADLVRQETANGTTPTVLHADSGSVGSAQANPATSVGNGVGTGQQSNVPQGVAGATVLDQAGVLPGRTDAAPLTSTASTATSNAATYANGGVFKTQKGANLYIKANKLDGQVEVHDTGNGFALAPVTSQETVGELKQHELAVSELAQLRNDSGLQRFNARDLSSLPDSEAVGVRRAARAVSLVGQITQTAFGFKPIQTTGLRNYGVAYRGNVFVDVGEVAADGKADIGRLAIFTIGHEATHSKLQQADAPQVKRDYANFVNVANQYMRENVAAQRMQAETKAALKDGSAAPTDKYVGNEIMADINGAMWLDHKFWAKLYEVDNGSTMRRIAYRFMQAATKFIEVAKGGRMDASKYVTNVALVRDAAAKAWASHANRAKTNRSDPNNKQFNKAIPSEAYSRRFMSVDDMAIPNDGNADDYAFNIDTNDDVDLDNLFDTDPLDGLDVTDVDMAEFDAAQQADAQAALQAELDAQARPARPTAIPAEPVTLDDLKKLGIHPESAYDQEIGGLTDGMAADGSLYKTFDGSAMQPGGWGTQFGEPSVRMTGDAKAHFVLAPGSFTHQEKLMKQEDAIKFAKHMLVAQRIQDAGFDIASAYRKGTVLKLAEAWKKLAAAKNAFKVPTPGCSKDFALLAQQMQAMPKYHVSKRGDDSHMQIEFRRKSDGVIFSAEITSTGSANGIKCCTMGLNGSGGDLGTRFYAVAGKYAELNGKRFFADSILSNINTARRTEQVLSFALKSGNSGVMLPGVQNRVYGYNVSPKTAEDHAMNIGRLLLAGMRNAIEIDPNIRRLRYDPATDRFTDSRGKDAQDQVDAFLAIPEARAYGMGRSTLARAVVTSNLIEGTLDASTVTAFKEPIAYSRKLDMEPLSESYTADDSGVLQRDQKATEDVAELNSDGIAYSNPDMQFSRKLKDGSDYDYDKAVAEKHERIRRFDKDRDAILAQLDKDAASGREAASVLRLMAVAGFRIGGDPDLSTKAQQAGTTKPKPLYQAFGASTLKPEHVRIEGSIVHFEFIGKANAPQKHSIDDAAIAKDLAKRMDREKLFTVSDRAVRSYYDSILNGRDYKTHDFRTWLATDTARRVVAANPQPTDAAEFWRVHDLAIEAAAGKIGDTLKVAEESYVDKTIFDAIRETSGVFEGQRKGNGKPSKTSNDKGRVGKEDAGVSGLDTSEVATYARKLGADELKYQHNYLVPEVEGMPTDGSIATLPGIVFARDGINQTFQSMPVRIRVGEHQDTERFSEQYGLQHRIDNKAKYTYRGYATPNLGKDSSAEVEQAARDIALGVLTAKTVYADTSKSTIYIHSPEHNRVTVLQQATDSEGQQFWNVKSSIPSTRDQMMRKYKAPTTIGGIMTGVDRTQQSVSSLTGVLNKLKEPGSFLASSESYILDEDGLLFNQPANKTADVPVDVAPKKQLARDENGNIILNKKKVPAPETKEVPYSRKFTRETVGDNFTLPSESKLSAARRALQDSFLPVLEMQKAIVKQGGTIGEAQDVYRAEERSHGRVEEAIKDFETKVFVPLVEKAAKDKLNMDEVALFAYAMHAPERNAHIASIDKKLQDGGSGMTNQEAADVLDAFRAEGKFDALEAIHKDLMAITATTRRTNLEEGLITQEQYDAMEAQYEYYIPLRGFAEKTEDDQPAPRRGGRGYNVRGQETMRALGRTSKAGDLIENVVADYEKAVVRGERNTVAKVFLDLVLANPDPGLWEIDATKTRKSFDKSTGKIARSTVIDTGEDTLAIKLDGKEVYVKVHDPRLVYAMRLASKDDTGAVGAFLNNTIGLYSTLMRNTLTRFNPAFSAVNAVRDFGMATVGVVDALGFKGQAKFAKHYAGATRASWRNERGTQKQDDWGKWFEEYRAAGATTGGYYARGVEDIKGDIRDIMLINGAAPKTFIEKFKANGGYAFAKKVGHVLEVLGSTSENAARVAAYRTAREMGKSAAESASIAKNLTTNFNRKGEWGQVINTAWVFFNASVQGSTKVLQTLANPKVQGLLAGAAAAGFAMALANASNGGDDDDGQAYWDKIPDFEKERNFIIMLHPGMDMGGAEKIGKHGRCIKIPMPYGFNVAPMLGQNLADVYRHGKDSTHGITVGQAAINMTAAAFGSFNPFGGAIDTNSGSSMLMSAMPSLMDVGVQMAMGVNAFGKPVAPFKSDMDTRLDSENVNPRQAGGWAHKTARALNKATGGNEVEAGKIDVSPGTIENMWRNATGGTGTFLSDVFVNLPMKTLSAESDITPKDLPILRSFYGAVDGTNNASLFYERRKAINEAAATQKRYDSADMERKPDPDFEALVSLSRSAASYTKALSQIRKDEIDVALDETLGRGDKAVKVKQIKRERDELTKEFNTEFMDAMRGKRDGEFGK